MINVIGYVCFKSPLTCFKKRKKEKKTDTEREITRERAREREIAIEILSSYGSCLEADDFSLGVKVV